MVSHRKTNEHRNKTKTKTKQKQKVGFLLDKTRKDVGAKLGGEGRHFIVQVLRSYPAAWRRILRRAKPEVSS